MARFGYEKPSAIEIPEEELESMAAVMRSGGGGGGSYDFAYHIEKVCGFMENTLREPLRKLADAVNQSEFSSKGNLYLAWLFFRLIGGFCYGGKFDKDIAWSQVAGSLPWSSSVVSDAVPSEEQTFFTKTLGLSQADYRSLRYWIRVQHESCGKDYEKPSAKIAMSKWSDYFTKNGKYTKPDGSKVGITEGNIISTVIDPTRAAAEGRVDLSHMCITVASMLATGLKLHSPLANTYINIYYPSLCDEIGENGAREAFAGWLGDATLIEPGENCTTMGDDDYGADLDALRVVSFVRDEGYDFSAAINSHYSSIFSVGRNRFFTGNYMGYDQAVTCMRLATQRDVVLTNETWLKNISKVSTYNDTLLFCDRLLGKKPEPEIWP